jgi:nitroimidazol reductase NimA-like FMN-containing flavoprotein (pyridoxamine 5'-phosphate oxidase superfamily)
MLEWEEREGVEEFIGPFGEEVRNPEGERLIDMCVRNNLKVMNGFFKHRESHMYTRYRWNQNSGRFDQRSVIDYFISSDKRIVNNVKVIPGVSLDADHRMIVAKVKVRNFRKQHLYKSKIIKTKSLNEQEKRTEYKRRINEKLNGWEEGGEVEWSNVESCLKEVAVEVLGEEWMGVEREGTRHGGQRK